MRLKIEIMSAQDMEDEAAHVAMDKARMLAAGSDNDLVATIQCFPRKPTGWLEYYISMNLESGHRVIMVAMIQREVGAEYEFHS